MARDMIGNALPAILSFLLGLYFGSEFADWAMAVVASGLEAHFPKVSAMFGSIRAAATMSDSAAAVSPGRRRASSRPCREDVILGSIASAES